MAKTASSDANLMFQFYSPDYMHGPDKYSDLSLMDLYIATFF